MVDRRRRPSIGTDADPACGELPTALRPGPGTASTVPSFDLG